MEKVDPPWIRPAALCAAGGGSRTQRRMANHWKRWDAKPEAEAQRELSLCAMLVRLQLANQRKRWDSKARG